MKIGKLLMIVLCMGFICSETFCQQPEYVEDLKMLSDNVFHLSEVMLHDVANPPAASRFYAYAMLGAYEAAFFGNSKLTDINKHLHEDPNVRAVPPQNLKLAFAANYAMLEVGRQLMPSGYLLADKQKSLTNFFKTKRKLSQQDISRHIRYATEIANQVVQYAKRDGYGKLSTFARYTPNTKEEGRWYPTPPEYMPAIEPRWETIRPFFLDSARQFKPSAPVSYSRDTLSLFYKQMIEVYKVVKDINKEQREIANFWDCNPFAVTYSGHMAIGLKKISPGGHWMSIAGIACNTANVPLDSAILIQTLVGLTLHDAFISCWQEKYFSDRIRPETAINKLLDPSWRPVLQTPPFPEYTSGHSVASSSAAVVLTYFLGENFSFTDTSEVYFGLPERHFNSFYEASNEAAISRLYGGIHFRDACEEGVVQGRRVGQFVLTRLFELRP